MSHSVTGDFEFVARAARTLAPVFVPTVAGGEPAAAPADSSVSKAAGSRLAAGHSSPPVTRHPSRPPSRATIFDAARPVIIKEILALLGGDMPDPIAHARYLASITFAALCARRDQLLKERTEEIKRQELNRNPELEFNAEPQRTQRSAKV